MGENNHKVCRKYLNVFEFLVSTEEVDLFPNNNRLA